VRLHASLKKPTEEDKAAVPAPSDLEKSIYASIDSLVTNAITQAAKSSPLSESLAQLKIELETSEKDSKERIRAEQDKFDVAKERFDKMKAEVEVRAKAVAGEIVRLNVGGAIFSASMDTFMSSPDSFFYAMLGSDLWVRNERGEYFIDRDPSLFPHVMTYLRTGRWYLNSLTADDFDRLEAELAFYALSLPRDWSSLDRFKAYSGISFPKENEGNLYTVTGSGTILGKDFLPSEAIWDVTVVAKTGNAWTGIGIATGLADLSSLCCDSSYGCGLYIDQNNCYFRQKGNNVEELNGIIGSATPGKVIRITFRRTDIRMTIKFQVVGQERATPDYVVTLPERKLYTALSPTSDCVLSLQVVENP